MSDDLDRQTLAAALQRRDESAPAFAAVFAAAKRRHARRRRARAAAGLAAAVVVPLLAIGVFQPAEEERPYVEVAEILNSTQWQAPSDVLLPDYSSGIYDELPAIPVSTEPAEGALL